MKKIENELNMTENITEKLIIAITSFLEIIHQYSPNTHIKEPYLKKWYGTGLIKHNYEL